MKLRKRVTIDVSASTVEKYAMDIGLPTGQIVRINSVSATAIMSGNDSGVFQPQQVAVATRDLALTTVGFTDIEDHDGIIGYGSLFTQPAFISDSPVAKPTESLIMNEDVAYGFEPVLYVGSTTSSANLGVVVVLFDVDYDIVKLTSSISSKVAALS